MTRCGDLLASTKYVQPHPPTHLHCGTHQYYVTYSSSQQQQLLRTEEVRYLLLRTGTKDLARLVRLWLARCGAAR